MMVDDDDDHYDYDDGDGDGTSWGYRGTSSDQTLGHDEAMLETS